MEKLCSLQETMHNELGEARFRTAWNNKILDLGTQSIFNATEYRDVVEAVLLKHHRSNPPKPGPKPRNPGKARGKWEGLRRHCPERCSKAKVFAAAFLPQPLWAAASRNRFAEPLSRRLGQGTSGGYAFLPTAMALARLVVELLAAAWPLAALAAVCRAAASAGRLSVRRRQLPGPSRSSFVAGLGLASARLLSRGGAGDAVVGGA